jgi:hypothetical protein
MMRLATPRESSMQYMLLIHTDETPFATASAAQQAQMMEVYGAYNQALEKAGILISGAPLAHSKSTIRVNVRGDRTEVLDGPYADTKEQLGGYYIIEAKSADEAVKWAARCPGASHGTVEVRALGGMAG